MIAPGSTETREKLALVWAARRERLIAVRISYQVSEEDGCTLYALQRVEEANSMLLGL